MGAPQSSAVNLEWGDNVRRRQVNGSALRQFYIWHFKSNVYIFPSRLKARRSGSATSGVCGVEHIVVSSSMHHPSVYMNHVPSRCDKAVVGNLEFPIVT